MDLFPCFRVVDLLRIFVEMLARYLLYISVSNWPLCACVCFCYLQRFKEILSLSSHTHVDGTWLEVL